MRITIVLIILLLLIAVAVNAAPTSQQPTKEQIDYTTAKITKYMPTAKVTVTSVIKDGNLIIAKVMIGGRQYLHIYNKNKLAQNAK
jgi:hypothetical protein